MPTQRKEGELQVIEAASALLVWTSQHAAQFPRSHRYSIGTRLENRVSRILDDLLRAKFSDQKAEILQDVNLQLEQLRFDFRSARELRCLSIDPVARGSSQNQSAFIRVDLRFLRGVRACSVATSI